MTYEISEHRHRFAAWAAARAIQRGFSVKVGAVREAIEKCGVVKFLAHAAHDEIGATRFDTLHREWCMSVVDFLEKGATRIVTFGRAAKLIAIYLKSAVVLGVGADSALARVAHPPIDSILLRKLAADSDIVSEHKRDWAKLRWTKLNDERYYELIMQLRQALGTEVPFWKLEYYWMP